MRILHVSTFSYKAAGNIMLNIHNELLRLGEESYVAWGRGREAENCNEYYMNDSIGVRAHGVYTRITDKHGFGSKKSTRKFLEWIDSIKPDIIHMHCIHGYYINIEMLFDYIKENKIKVIWTQHDCWAFTGHCAYFDACGCTKWQNGCHHCQQLNTYPASKVLDRSKWNWKKKKEIFQDLDLTLVTPCTWLAELLKKSFLAKNDIITIYNGIDREIFKITDSKSFIEKNSINCRKIILGVASEWTERKGLKDFVLLDSMIDHEKYLIVIVGVTEKQKKSLPKSMLAISRTNSAKELAEIYSAAFVVFNPTYEDNFPTIILEATACGTYVITYDTGGCKESLNDKTGSVIQKGDIQEALDIIESIELEDEVKLDDQFNKKSMILKYIELYNYVNTRTV